MITIIGAGGFIGGHLVNYFNNRGHFIRAIDIKPFKEWHQIFPAADNLILDCSNEESCKIACERTAEVYNLAADMGGMGFIENNRISCLRNVLINTNLIEAAYQAGVQKYFFASSACVYNTNLQYRPVSLKENDAYPALAERGYGWEKLFSEIVCQEYWQEKKMKTFIARLHNVYGPYGTWCGGKEKVPAAICRKVTEAIINETDTIEIWGDGKQLRSFTYIDDCITGIIKITQKEELAGIPINLGSSEMVSINELVSIVEGIAGVKLIRKYNGNMPIGVKGRNSDNTFIKQMLGWEPTTSLNDGMKLTYDWVSKQVI